MCADNAEKTFSVVKRAKSFTHAGRGVWLFVKMTHNAWIHLVIAFIVVIVGMEIGIQRTDWIALVFAIGLVLVAEAFNTAIEIDIDLTSPEYHPFARDTKDVAAGAVLLAALTAVAIGVFVFMPYLPQMLSFL